VRKSIQKSGKGGVGWEAHKRGFKSEEKNNGCPTKKSVRIWGGPGDRWKECDGDKWNKEYKILIEDEN